MISTLLNSTRERGICESRHAAHLKTEIDAAIAAHALLSLRSVDSLAAPKFPPGPSVVILRLPTRQSKIRTRGRRGLPRILALTPIYPWAGNPDEGIFVHRQLRNLQRLGHHVRVIAYHPAVPGIPRSLVGVSWLRYHPRWITWPAQRDDIDVRHVFYPQRRRDRGDVIPDIAKVVCDAIASDSSYRETDLVYAHWLWSAGATALAVRSVYGWPVAAIARGSEMHRWQDIHPHCTVHVQQVIREADLVLANCEFLRNRALNLVSDSNHPVAVAYNGVDVRSFHPAAERLTTRARLGLREDRRYVLCCATLAQHKGVIDLAHAWAHFAASNSGWELRIIGTIPRAALAREFRRIAGPHAEIVGPVASHDIPRWMQCVDAYVQPSRLEGLSNATMEAMASGLPVLSTDAGGQCEVVSDGESGWVVPAGNVAAMTHALGEMASNPDEALRRATNARSAMTREFEGMHHARLLSRALRELHGAPAAERELVEQDAR